MSIICISVVFNANKNIKRNLAIFLKHGHFPYSLIFKYRQRIYLCQPFLRKRRSRNSILNIGLPVDTVLPDGEGVHFSFLNLPYMPIQVLVPFSRKRSVGWWRRG